MTPPPRLPQPAVVAFAVPHVGTAYAMAVVPFAPAVAAAHAGPVAILVKIWQFVRGVVVGAAALA